MKYHDTLRKIKQLRI